MATRLGQICAFLSTIHTNKKLNSVVFNHYYQYHNIKYEPAIALINKKSETLYQFRRVTAINFSFDKKKSAVTRGINTNDCRPGAEIDPVWWFTIFRNGKW